MVFTITLNNCAWRLAPKQRKKKKKSEDITGLGSGKCRKLTKPLGLEDGATRHESDGN
jgi:hypothetical protein